MKKGIGWAVALGCWMAASCAMAVTQDWKQLGPGFAGTFADKDGSTIALGSAEGPRPGEKALVVKAHIVGWAGAWATFNGDLSKEGALRFQAKSPEPELVEVGLMDARNIQYTAVFRITSGGWRVFTIPLSLFEKAAFQMPEAPKDKPIDWTRIVSLQWLPQTHGDLDLQVGPVSFVVGKQRPQTGGREEKDRVTVQDFLFLDKTAYGPFVDGKTGTSIDLSLEKDAEGGRLALFHCDLKRGGWCGFWMRAGDAWGGQDWTGAKSMTLEVFSSEPVRFQMGFNDGNQNAFVAETRETRGKGWERLAVPFGEFHLNPYYQPPEAKKGSVQDLVHVETLNIAPLTEGKHEFKVRRITVEK
ncbi:MAG TPA: carbohydrate binding domain-containing protein [bacterium]|nr:carbohydrate binding domain-containing protein [bacterium]